MQQSGATVGTPACLKPPQRYCLCGSPPWCSKVQVQLQHPIKFSMAHSAVAIIVPIIPDVAILLNLIATVAPLPSLYLPCHLTKRQ